MAETTWAEESPAGPPKKKIPTWVWFVGGGCLALLVLGIGALVLIMGLINNATNPDKQWEAIAKILPYDERPPDMQPVFGMNVGVEQYILHDARGYEIQLQHFAGHQAAETREKMFEKDPPEIPKDMVVFKLKEMKTGPVEVQGREIHVVRAKGEFSGFMKKVVPKEGQDQVGGFLWADVTPEGRDDLVFMQVQRSHRGKDAPPEGPISDDELRELLKPFHVGPKR